MMRSKLLSRRNLCCWMGISLLTLGLYTTRAAAQCYIVSYNTRPSSSANNYVEDGAGSWKKWDGAQDVAGSSGGLPSVVNINNLAFQPEGTLIASGSDSFYNLGLPANGQYEPEQVLFRCTPDEAGNVFEYYATNGDSTYAGMYEDGAAAGIPEGYATHAQGIVLRVTNTTTGEYYSRYWKARALTGLDTDSKGYLLVKAKNFSGVRTEIFRVNNSRGSSTFTGVITRKQPAAYIAFKGGQYSKNLSVGADSASKYGGWPSAWPGAVTLWNKVIIRRSATCMVSNVTPNVLFPLITVAELNQGKTRQAPVQVRFACQTGAPASNGVASFISGTAANETAMGILVQPANAVAAIREGFGTSGGGIGYLLSDGYGTDTSVATGVGIQISDKNANPLTLLSSLGGFSMGNSAGWYAVLDGADKITEASGVTYYTKNLFATLKKLPGKNVTAGKIRAKAQVVIEVQ